MIGSIIMPLSERFTRSTCDDCSVELRFLCMIPIPPSRASAIANWDSVTVSMAAEMMGILRSILPVSLVFTSVSAGTTLEWAGTRSTSSKVSASLIFFSIFSLSLILADNIRVNAMKGK